jgi:hypothetical protein
MSELLTIGQVTLLAYLLSATFETPLLIVCWLYGLRIRWQTAAAAAGWGAVAIVLVSMLIDEAQRWL